MSHYSLLALMGSFGTFCLRYVTIPRKPVKGFQTRSPTERLQTWRVLAGREEDVTLTLCALTGLGLDPKSTHRDSETSASGRNRRGRRAGAA